MVDIVIEFDRVGALSELLYFDDLILVSETIEDNCETIMGLKNKFIKLKEAFESKGL